MQCVTCGKSLRGRDRRTKYCDTKCRVAASQRRKRGVPELVPAPDVVLAVAIESDGPVFAAALAELTDASRQNTALGQAALALARRIDAGKDTGSALAGAVRQLGQTLTEATRGAKLASSPLDELRARRDAKRPGT